MLLASLNIFDLRKHLKVFLSWVSPYQRVSCLFQIELVADRSLIDHLVYHIPVSHVPAPNRVVAFLTCLPFLWKFLFCLYWFAFNFILLLKGPQPGGSDWQWSSPYSPWLWPDLPHANPEEKLLHVNSPLPEPREGCSTALTRRERAHGLWYLDTARWKPIQASCQVSEVIDWRWHKGLASIQNDIQRHETR